LSNGDLHKMQTAARLFALNHSFSDQAANLARLLA
jgi:hypothetical protein